MPLRFPNPSRSFDEKRKGVRFTGHDGMFEIPFFLEAAALGKLKQVEPTERDLLAAFDAARKSILDVAREAYSHGRRKSYTLTARDFR